MDLMHHNQTNLSMLETIKLSQSFLKLQHFALQTLRLHKDFACQTSPVIPEATFTS